MIEFEVEKYNKNGVKYFIKNEMIKKKWVKFYTVVFPEHNYECLVSEGAILKNSIRLPRDYIIGKTFKSIRGEEYMVLGYSHTSGKKSENKYYRIKFIKSGLERTALYKNIVLGKIKFMYLDVVGKTFINNYGDKYEVIEKINETHYKIRFETGNEMVVRSDRFLKNNMVNIKHTSIFNVGYLDGESTNSFLYRRWKGMLDRCYDKNDKDYKWYGEKGVKVCDEWLSFKNYKELRKAHSFRCGMDSRVLN